MNSPSVNTLAQPWIDAVAKMQVWERNLFRNLLRSEMEHLAHSDIPFEFTRAEEDFLRRIHAQYAPTAVMVFSELDAFMESIRLVLAELEK